MAERRPVPAEMAAELQVETYFVRQALQAGNRAAIPGFENSIAEIAWRLQHLQGLGLSYVQPIPGSTIEWGELRLATAEVALVHGLVYESNGRNSRYIPSDGMLPEDQPITTRGRNYFSEVFSSRDADSLPGIELALLAHVFRTPIPVLTAPSRPVFEAFAADIATGVNYYHADMDFLERMTKASPSLAVVHTFELEALLTPKRVRKGFVVNEEPDQTSALDINEPISVHAPLRSQLGPAIQAIILGAEQNQWRLLSTPKMTEDSMRFSGDLIFPSEKINESRATPLKIDEPGPFGVVLVASTEPLEEFPAWIRCRRATRSNAAAAGLLTEEDFRWLREQLLARDPRRTVVLMRHVEVFDERAAGP